MTNGEATDGTLITSELLKWIRLQTRKWIATIMDQAIKQVFWQIGS